MAHKAVPKTEMQYLLDVERALMQFVRGPAELPPPPEKQEASLAHAFTRLQRAGLSEGAADNFVRLLRSLGIERPGRFVFGLLSDYKHANQGWRLKEGALHRPDDDFESVAFMLETILFHRPDCARPELIDAAIVLADQWLEVAGYQLPDAAPFILILHAFHAGFTATEHAEGLRQLVAWANTKPTISKGGASEMPLQVGVAKLTSGRAPDGSDAAMPPVGAQSEASPDEIVGDSDA